jgi:cephalosporin-C deacetylase-like acetyl esterase
MKKAGLFLIGIICLSACNENKRIDAVVTQSFSGQWKFHAGKGENAHWETADFNDSVWISVSSNQTLAGQGIALENNFGWYRKTIIIADSLKQAILAAGAAVIRLGKFAAADEVYLNGKLAGKTGDFPDNYTGYRDEERNYIVQPEDFNWEGKNVIAIRFFDGWGAGGFLDDTPLQISSATTQDKLNVSVAVLDRDYIFLSPNPIAIQVKVENNNRWPVSGTLLIKLTTDDYQPVSYDSVCIALNPEQSAVLPFTLNNPDAGFYRYTISLVENGKTACEKKFNAGYEPEKIVSPVDAKDDFKSFWKNNLAELSKIAPDYKLALVPAFSEGDYNIYLVEMRSLDNETIRGYYGAPKQEGRFPVVVEYMGYGSKPYPPTQVFDGFAYFVLSVRGQALNEPENRFGKWITFGLQDKNHYYYRGAFCDVVRAIDFVCSRPEIDVEKIAVRGGSQGGALSFVAAALDKRVKAAAPNIPFLSDYRDYFAITNWPESDFEEYLQQHPASNWEAIYDVLTYFDIKNLAPMIECPVLMGIGVQDDVCPPHINFAAYNQVSSEKQWMAFPDCGHSVGKAFYDAQALFFKKHLKIK